MRKEEKKGRKTSSVPAAFEKFVKKANPKEEIKAIAREERRRKAEAAEGEGDKAKRKRKASPDSSGPAYEHAGTSNPGAKPKERKERKPPRGKTRDARPDGPRFAEGKPKFPKRDAPGRDSKGRFSKGAPPSSGDPEADNFEQAWNDRLGKGGRKSPGYDDRPTGGFRPTKPADRSRPYPPRDGERNDGPPTERRFTPKKPKGPIEQRKASERSIAGDLNEPMRLNRFIALSGICSRREADSMIQKGLVTVNGEVVKELGVKVLNGTDEVIVNGKKLSVNQFVYYLMNKPKNMISTTEDDQGRPTVMDIVQKYTSVRVYPVGRLDRNTTGLLLFTNDGELAKKLSHPSHEFQKLYHVRLDKNLEEDHLAQLKVGVELEDGLAAVDDIEYVEGAARNEVGLKIHIGKNRIVRRMFEHLGYEVIMLDRTQYGPLHKVGIKRGTCRPLTPAEIGWLKMVK